MNPSGNINNPNEEFIHISSTARLKDTDALIRSEGSNVVVDRVDSKLAVVVGAPKTAIENVEEGSRIQVVSGSVLCENNSGNILYGGDPEGFPPHNEEALRVKRNTGSVTSLGGNIVIENNAGSVHLEKITGGEKIGLSTWGDERLSGTLSLHCVAKDEEFTAQQEGVIDGSYQPNGDMGMRIHFSNPLEGKMSVLAVEVDEDGGMTLHSLGEVESTNKEKVNIDAADVAASHNIENVRQGERAQEAGGGSYLSFRMGDHDMSIHSDDEGKISAAYIHRIDKETLNGAVQDGVLSGAVYWEEPLDHTLDHVTPTGSLEGTRGGCLKVQKNEGTIKMIEEESGMDIPKNEVRVDKNEKYVCGSGDIYVANNINGAVHHVAGSRVRSKVFVHTVSPDDDRISDSIELEIQNSVSDSTDSEVAREGLETEGFNPDESSIRVLCSNLGKNSSLRLGFFMCVDESGQVSFKALTENIVPMGGFNASFTIPGEDISIQNGQIALYEGEGQSDQNLLASIGDKKTVTDTEGKFVCYKQTIAFESQRLTVTYGYDGSFENVIIEHDGYIERRKDS